MSIPLVLNTRLFTSVNDTGTYFSIWGRQTMAVIKGVEDNFDRLTPIDSILFGRGELLLHDEVADYAIPGIELVSILGTGIRFH